MKVTYTLTNPAGMRREEARSEAMDVKAGAAGGDGAPPPPPLVITTLVVVITTVVTTGS